MAIEDGGPAFPVSYSNEADGPTVMPSAGMSMRDYFAAKAMLFIGAPNPATGQFPSPDDHETIAARAYHMADAMLKARQQ